MTMSSHGGRGSSGQGSGYHGPEDDPKASRLPGFLDVSRSFLTPKEGWLTVALLLAMNLVVVAAIQRAEWVDPMPRLWMVGLLAFVVGLTVAKIRAPLVITLVLLLLALAVGAAVSLWEVAGTVSTTGLEAKFTETFDRLREWLSAARASDISNDRLPFAFGLTALVWLVVFFSTWFLFRFRAGWAAVVLPALGLLTNQTYLPNSHYPVPLFFFLLFAILLLGRVHFLNLLATWGADRFQRRPGGFTTVANIVVLTALVLGAGWAAPTQKIVVPRFAEAYETARGPWADLEDEWERVFAGVSSKRASPLHSFGLALPLRGRISLGTGDVFSVTTDFPSYWRGQSYDEYQGRGWLASEEQRESVRGEKVYTAASATPYTKREPIAQRIVLNTAVGVIFTAGTPIEVSISTEAEVAVPREFEIRWDGEGSLDDLPADLSAAADSMIRAGGDTPERFLPPGTRIVKERSNRVVVARDDPVIPDILSLRSRGKLKVGSSYDVVSTISIAREAELRADDTEYPSWVTDNYLQLPETLPDRVRELGASVTQSVESPFDKAIAIAEYLRAGYVETYQIDPPPVNVDAVDYFLFTQRAGYSDYFASAMTVLLRSTGVPARLASGYKPGLLDEQTSTFQVRIADAHSWPEVFFPTYGWIPFEASPTVGQIPRGPLSEAFGEFSGDIFEDPQGLLDFDPFDEFDEDFLLDDFVSPTINEPVSTVFGDWARRIGIALGLAAGGVLGLLLLLYVVWQFSFLGLPYTHGIYERMSRLGSLVWRPPQGPQTPDEYAAMLASNASLSAAYTGAIAGGFVKNRYGARQIDDEERELIQKAWESIRWDLARRVLLRINPASWRRRG